MSKKRKNRGRISQLRARKTLRRNILKTVLHGVAWIGFAILYYATFSILFDTPYELYLKRSSQRLQSEYYALQSRFDSLDMVIRSVEERDRNIFRILFESSPYSNFENEDMATKRFDTYKANINRSTKELIEELTNRSDGFEKSVEELILSTQSMVLNIEHNSGSIAHIPAIQPIANSQLTLLTASYGERIHPFYKSLHPHLGVDYTVPEGTRVFATADGIIKSYTLISSPSGKSVTIDHGNGYETYYAHLAKIDIPRNHRVKRGDIIGLSGNTGLSITPHLHYEVRYQGEPINPIDYFFMELTPKKMARLNNIARSGMQAFD